MTDLRGKAPRMRMGVYFDNSGSSLRWLAEITDGKRVEFKTPKNTAWFKKYFLDKFQS